MKRKVDGAPQAAFGVLVMKAMRRAVRRARASARIHDLPMYVWRDGKIVADRS